MTENTWDLPQGKVASRMLEVREEIKKIKAVYYTAAATDPRVVELDREEIILRARMGFGV